MSENFKRIMEGLGDALAHAEAQGDHFPFPSIEGLHNVIRTHEVYPHIFPETTHYRGKPKLHGTNAGVRVTADGVVAQSRSTDLLVTADHHGFAKWVQAHETFFRDIREKAQRDLVVFGEWAGVGIMKGTGLNLLTFKFFAIFMIAMIDHEDRDWRTIIVDPAEIADMVGETPDDVYVLPWAGQPLSVTWADRATAQTAAEIANKEIEQLEVCDPWIKATFGVEGVGEGLVYYPLGVSTVKRFGDFAFKAKGGKHKVAKTREAVQVDPEVLASIDAFIEHFVTEARLEQGLEAIGGRADPLLTGQFLAWVGRDVEKESQDELEANDLEWKQVVKPLSSRARQWYLARAKAI